MFSSANFLLLPLHSPCPFIRSAESPIFRPFTISKHRSLSLSSAHKSWFAELAEQVADPIPDEGPIELPSSSMPSIFAFNDDPTPLQTATSVLLTGAISVFLFRSLRRRAKRAKEMKLRSSGAKKSLKEEALESLKTVSLSPVNAKAPPSPVQAFLGAFAAGVIAVILYNFTTTIEASLNRQTMPDNYSVRQITVTIRTIINGLCYLATFVFGANALGLFLYSGQLAFNSFMDDSNSEAEAPPGSSNSDVVDKNGSGSGVPSSTEDKSSDNTQ